MLGEGMRAPIDLVIAQIGTAAYGLPLASVIRLCRAVAIVALPRAPAIVAGIINVRGQLVPVLNLRARFGLPPREVAPEDHFVIAAAGRRVVAIVADRVREVAQVDAAAVETAEGLGSGIEYVAGIAKLPGGLVVIHDLATFLSAAEATHLDEALAGAGAEGPST